MYDRKYVSAVLRASCVCRWRLVSFWRRERGEEREEGDGGRRGRGRRERESEKKASSARSPPSSDAGRHEPGTGRRPLHLTPAGRDTAHSRITCLRGKGQGGTKFGCPAKLLDVAQCTTEHQLGPQMLGKAAVM